MSERCKKHTMYDPTCPACQWGTKTPHQERPAMSFAGEPDYEAAAEDKADARRGELCDGAKEWGGVDA